MKYKNGMKFYYFDKTMKEPYTLRILSQDKESNTYKGITKDNEIVECTDDDLIELVLITPHAFFNITSVVNASGDADIIVTLYLQKELSNNINIPFVVCRQNVYDVFVQYLDPLEKNVHLGMSINKDNCPEGLKFEVMLYCDQIFETESFAVYMNDNILDIVKLIDTSVFDNVLSTLYDKIKNNIVLTDNVVIGASDSVYSLLENNTFEDDFLYSFGIRQVDFNITILTNNLVSFLESEINHIVLDPVLIDYDLDIDLNMIQGEYKLFKDLSKKLFVLKYTKGEIILDNAIKLYE